MNPTIPAKLILAILADRLHLWDTLWLHGGTDPVVLIRVTHPPFQYFDLRSMLLIDCNERDFLEDLSSFEYIGSMGSFRAFAPNKTCWLRRDYLSVPAGTEFRVVSWDVEVNLLGTTKCQPRWIHLFYRELNEYLSSEPVVSGVSSTVLDRILEETL